MSRKSRIAVTILTAALVALSIYAVPSAIAKSSSHALRFKVVKRTSHYDIVKGHSHRFAVKRGAHKVTVHGVGRYRLVRRTPRYVFLRTAKSDWTPRPTITTPKSGDFVTGSPTKITWRMSSAASSGYFRVSLTSTLDGASTGLTATSIPANRRTRNYSVPWDMAQPVGTYRLWVYYYSSSGAVLASDVSDFSASISDAPTPTPTPTPIPTPTTVPPKQGEVIVPSHATKAQIDASVASAVAVGPGTWVVFPAETFAYSGTFTVPDNINIRGQGIWDQGVASGGGGTWLQATSGMRWGSHSTIERMLVGQNTPGLTCQFRPVARGTSSAGADTQANGSHNVTFNFVRFKGGSDTGAPLLDLSSNYSGTWTGTLKKIDMVNTTWNDSEFERPQSTNAVNGTSLGAIMNIWWDVRPGGAQVHDLTFRRTHFGVENGYHSGLDGYGSGRTILFQGAPSSSDSSGPAIGGGSVITSTNWNPQFNWGQFDHGLYNVVIEDSLFEYASWYPMDITDYARPYSMWRGVQAGASDGGASIGWGNPPGSHWVDIPTAMWTDNFSITRSYFKGSYPNPHSIVYEVGRNAEVVDSYSGTGGFGNHSGRYGSTLSGTFSNSKRPATDIFNVDWNGASTSYTPSPFDP